MNVKSILGSYLGHLTGYVLAGADIISKVNPSLVPPQYGLLISVAGLVVIASHHSYAAGSAGVQSAVDAAAKALTASKVVAPVLLLGLVLGLGGCASLQSFTQKASAAVTSPQAAPYVKAGALVAVTSAESHGVTAAQINAVAKKALAADSGAGASLAAVQAVLDAELAKLNLPAGDLLAISIVEAEFNAYVQTQIGTDPTLANAQAAAADIFQAVIAATGG